MRRGPARVVLLGAALLAAATAPAATLSREMRALRDSGSPRLLAADAWTRLR